MSAYQGAGKLSQNSFITDPTVPDPENLPQPLGWTILVRPYPVKETTKGGIIMSSGEVDYINNTSNIGRVVAVGPCCWSQPQHRDKHGNKFDWVKVGDFISYPKHTGGKRKFKGVSFILLNDDEITDFLPDPLVFNEVGNQMDIPEEDLKKYNTIYNENYKGNTNV